MKILFFSLLLISNISIAQNVGIGETNPADTRLQVKRADSALLMLHNSSFGTDIKSGLFFKSGGSYSGSIITTGNTATQTFRMSFSTFGSTFPSGLIERISILDGGNVGIGNINPTTKLDINGQIKISGGTPGVGKLLESDATGLATWADKSAYLLPVGVNGNTLRHTGAGWATNTLLYNNGTNIGIGTTIPNYILDVNGRARLRYNGATSGMWYNKADNTEAAFVGMFNDTIFGHYGGNGWQIGMDVKNGMLGIGNLAPKAPLSFPNTTGNKIALWGDATGGHYGIGIQGSLMQLYTSASNADIVFGYGKSTSFSETMRIKGNGKVGIGGISPTDYQLHVLGWPNDKLLQLENTDLLDAGINNTIMFQTGGKYTGAIKTIGVDANTASLGFYTGTSAAESSLTRRMTIANSGNIGIGTFQPTAKLHIEDISASVFKTPFYISNQDGNSPQNYIELGYKTNVTNKGGYFSAANNSSCYGLDCYADGTGYTAAIYGSSTTFNGFVGTRYAGYFQGNLAYTGTLINASDATLKTNIKPLENALTSINKLQIKQYQFTDESNKILNTTPGLHIGVLAQQLQEVFPTLVSKQVQPIKEKVKDKNGVEKIEQTGTKEYLGVNYIELIPVLIKGMQEQQIQIDELKKKIEILEKK